MRELVAAYDVVVDGSDNFADPLPAQRRLREPGPAAGVGAIYKFEGQVSVFNYAGGPTYRCLFLPAGAAEAPDCNATGVLDVLPGLIGMRAGHRGAEGGAGPGRRAQRPPLVLDTLSAPEPHLRCPTRPGAERHQPRQRTWRLLRRELAPARRPPASALQRVAAASSAPPTPRCCSMCAGRWSFGAADLPGAVLLPARAGRPRRRGAAHRPWWCIAKAVRAARRPWRCCAVSWALLTC
ncbi:MAG: hypothetical protein WKG07_11105 [Hymenobacter sp.]